MYDKEFTKSLSLEVEATNSDGEVTAYITHFGSPDKVGDVFLPKSFDSFLGSFDPKKKKLPMYWQHDSRDLIGEWVELTKDSNGILGKGIIYTDTTKGKDTMALLKRKAVAGVSVGFKSNSYQDNEYGGFTFHNAYLAETSIVLNPANDLARVISVKSEDGFIETSKLKNLLKEGGLTSKEIDALFYQGWKGLKELRLTEEAEENTNKVTQEEVLEALKSFKL